MTTDIKLSERLIYTDLANNNNKFWHGEVVDCQVKLNWGRVGDVGQFKTLSFNSPDAAQHNFETTVRSKLRKGYTRQHTLAEGQQKLSAATIKREIKADNNPETTALIDFLVKRNIHKIEGSTKIRFEAGMLTTPLGPVTADGLDEAEKLLAIIVQQNQDFADAVNSYLRIVPRAIGRQKVDPKTLFGTVDQVQAEQAMVDSLRAVLKDLEDKANADADPVEFSTRLEVLSHDTNDFSRIDKYFKSTMNDRHLSAKMRLAKIWIMDIELATKLFEERLGNIKELWHGTKDANLLSILKNGYVIPKRGGSVAITGRMFGDGVYFSDQSTKSLNYTSAFWGGQASQRNFMLLNDVAMGREYVPSRGGISKIPAGYDSCFAKAGASGVMNNEMIVYRTTQVRPKYLCEFHHK